VVESSLENVHRGLEDEEREKKEKKKKKQISTLEIVRTRGMNEPNKKKQECMNKKKH